MSAIHQYCDVTGYVAPQPRFELKLPLPGDWNQKFFFAGCGGFCGAVDGTRCNLGLAHGDAAAKGGHDSSDIGFDGLWAANAPNLQDDYRWCSSHVVRLIAKAITGHFYGKPIKYSYMISNSKGGQSALLETQKFPEDFDGLGGLRCAL
jgi:feruloyl esterase